MHLQQVKISVCGGMLGEAFYKNFKEAYELKCTDIDVNEEWLGFLDFRELEAYIGDVKSRYPKREITRKMSPLTYEILKIRALVSPTAPFDYRPDYYANHYIEPVFKNACLKGMSAKHLRSTAAGHVYLRERDIYAASSFLRHSSVQVTEQNYVGLLDKEKYDSPRTLEDIFLACLQNINNNGCKWDQMSEEEEAKLCGDIAKGLEELLLKIQEDTASNETVSS